MILSRIKRRLKKIILGQQENQESSGYGRTSYAQEGEDVLLWRILDAQHSRIGTYVEVGSNHPWRCSNTAFFYLQGWSGVAIDPNPDFAIPFRSERTRDIFLNVGISDTPETLTYHRFPESLYNTFCSDKAKQLVNSGIMPEPEKVDVPVMRLRDALAQVWPAGKKLDLLSIDAEGFDERIVKSHDFEMYPARFVIIEFESTLISVGITEPLVGLLRDRGFLFISKLWKSGLFVHQSAAGEFGI